jgi:hypothetical protein
MLKGLLQKLRGGGAAPPAPTASIAGLPPARRDDTHGNPLAASLQQSLRGGDWRGAADLLAGVRDDWQLRSFLVGLATDQAGRPTWLDTWVAERPDDAGGWLVRGGQAIKWAWEARGNGKVEGVDDDGRRLMHERIDLAVADLLEATRRGIDDPTPWALLIPCSIALGNGLEEASDWFAEAISRDPFHFAAHKQMLTRLCEKWGGSHAAMFQLARQASAAAPPGSRVHELVVTAHFERYRYYHSWEKDQEAAFAHLESARDEVEEADARRFPAGEPGDRWYDLAAHNELACFYCATGLRERARHHLAATGGVYTGHPWDWYGGVPEGFDKARQWAFAPADKN